MQSLLPSKIVSALSYVNISKLCEIRLRVDKSVIVNISGKLYFLTPYGVSDSCENAIFINRLDIEYVISKASNNSLYTINDQIINGYIACKGGIRIGIAGEFVYTNGVIRTLKNIQALNIRIPHEVNGCSLRVFRYLEKNNTIYNTLILSSAGAGKTTFIRDLAKQILRNSDGLINLLIVDERCEITGISDGNVAFEGFNCDILSNCTKVYAFDNGIRSLRPDIIITDELSVKDVDCIVNAVTCGVKVIATVHAENILDLKNKADFKYILDNKLFDRYVVLGSSEGIGTIMGVYNEELECIGI